MQRRTFMQTVAAAFAATVAGRLPGSETVRAIDYSLFTDADAGFPRYTLRTPWSDKGMVYASDSRVLIAHPGEFSGDGSGVFPDMSKMWWEEFDRRGWKEFPAQHLVESDNYGNCPACRGKGRVGPGVTTCPKCFGEYEEYIGDDMRVVGHRMDLSGRMRPIKFGCRCIRGHVGGSACSQCEGTGDTKWYAERVGGVKLDGGYANAVRTLGCVDYRIFEGGPVYKCDTREKYNLLAFRFADGGRGFLMPLGDTNG